MVFTEIAESKDKKIKSEKTPYEKPNAKGKATFDYLTYSRPYCLPATKFESLKIWQKFILVELPQPFDGPIMPGWMDLSQETSLCHSTPYCHEPYKHRILAGRIGVNPRPAGSQVLAPNPLPYIL
jgi:hypothetical protein